MDSFHLASRSHRRWGNFVTGWQPEELSYVHTECCSQPVQQVDTRAEPLSFNIADRRPVNVGVNRQRFLTQPLESPNTTQIPSDAGSTLHAPQAINLRTIKPSDISDIIALCGRASKVGASVRLNLKVIVGCLIVLGSVLATGGEPTAQENDDPLNLLGGYEGWWAFGGLREACGISGPDAGKVAIGRFEMGNDGPVFGQGTPKLGTWDASCELHQPELIEGKIEAIAICTAEEGEQLVGRARIFGSIDDVEVQSPIGNFEITRCETGIAGGLNLPVELDLEPPSIRSEDPPPAVISGTGEATTGGHRPLFSPPTGDVILDMPDGRYVVRRKNEAGSVTPPKTDSHRSAIVSVYQDNCDPTFGSLDAAPDPELYARYGQQLLLRYQADCARFHSEQVLPAVVVDDVRYVIELPAGSSGLDEPAAFFLGLWLFTTYDADYAKCPVDSDLSPLLAALDMVASPLASYARAGDTDQIAKGFAAGVEGWRNLKAQYGPSVCVAPRIMAPIMGAQVLQSTMVVRLDQ